MKNKQKTSSYQGSYKIAGGPVGVLLLHSLGGTPVELRHLAQSLGRSGYTVSCPIVPGLTAGTDVSGISTWEDWFASIEDSYRELAETCETIYVGGLSAGAILSLHLAAHHPEKVRGILLLAPTLWPNGWAIPWYFNFFRLVNDRYSARMFHFKQREPFGIKDDRIRKFAIESFSNDDRPVEDMFGRGGGLVYQFARLVKVVQREISRIKIPTLIIHPRCDDQSDLKNAFRIQRGLGGLVETLVLDDSYHMVTLDRQRNLVVDRSVEFVERLASAEAMRTAAAGRAVQLATGRAAAE